MENGAVTDMIWSHTSLTHGHQPLLCPSSITELGTCVDQRVVGEETRCLPSGHHLCQPCFCFCGISSSSAGIYDGVVRHSISFYSIFLSHPMFSSLQVAGFGTTVDDCGITDNICIHAILDHSCQPLPARSVFAGLAHALINVLYMVAFTSILASSMRSTMRTIRGTSPSFARACNTVP